MIFLDNDNGVSRASSVSGKDKSIGGRRGRNERRRRDSGSFESRAQYAVYYPPPQQSPWAAQPQYIHVATPPFNGQVQPPFPNQAVPVYIPPGQSFPTMMPNTGYPPTYTNMPQVCTSVFCPQLVFVRADSLFFTSSIHLNRMLTATHLLETPLPVCTDLRPPRVSLRRPRAGSPHPLTRHQDHFLSE